MSQLLRSNLLRPIGSNWTEHSAGSAATRTGALLLRGVERRIGGPSQRVEQGEVGERGESAAGEDDRLSPDPVRKPAEQDEEGRRQRQRDRDQDVGGGAVDPQRFLEEEQRVELAGIPDHRLAGDGAEQGDQDDLEVGPARERLGQRRLRALALLLHLPEDRALLELQPDPQRDGEEQDRDQERDPPAPGGEFLLAQPGADRDDDEQGREQAERRGGLDEAGVEAALPGGRMLGDVGRRAAIFAAQRQALDQPQKRPAGSAPRRRSPHRSAAGRPRRSRGPSGPW